MKKQIFKISFLVILILSISSCITLNMQELEGLNEKDLFNKAQLMQQNAIVTRQYENTIKVYELYNIKFPDQKARVLVCKYEIGYINYYLKRFDKAENIFRSIIKEIDQGANQFAPPWIKVLSQNLKEKIQKERTERILKKSKKRK